ncbi:hypothetical protein HMN09_01212300 [Mycena chlorophos]|uniref:Uncharacterized protein n=1 Tax=Mycena chlorophos TaxID=658473 RepID=A0A8H6VVD6_MYCCL|nr:hypothetical protein HMN09_01212300 [Mycena chlorophos]
MPRKQAGNGKRRVGTSSKSKSAPVLQSSLPPSEPQPKTRARYTYEQKTTLADALREVPTGERSHVSVFEKIWNAEESLQDHPVRSLYDQYHRNRASYDEMCARPPLKKPNSQTTIFHGVPTLPPGLVFKLSARDTRFVVGLGLQRLADTHGVDLDDAVDVWQRAGHNFSKAEAVLLERSQSERSSKRSRSDSSSEDEDDDDDEPPRRKAKITDAAHAEDDEDEDDSMGEDAGAVGGAVDEDDESDEEELEEEKEVANGMDVDVEGGPNESEEDDDSEDPVGGQVQSALAEDSREDEKAEDEDDDDDETGEGAVEANSAGNEEEDTEEEDSDEEKAPAPVPQPTTRKRSSTTATTVAASSNSEPEDDEEEEKEEEAYIPTQASLFGTQMGPSRRRWG